MSKLYSSELTLRFAAAALDFSGLRLTQVKAAAAEHDHLAGTIEAQANGIELGQGCSINLGALKKVNLRAAATNLVEPASPQRLG